MEILTTQRGFPYAEFKDQKGVSCSIQISSLADDRCIWLGVDDPDPMILASDAIRLGIDTSGQNTGWVKYPIHPAIHCKTRMHLNMQQVKELLPMLQKFAETGEI